MTPQLLIASAELLHMDVPAAFRRALGHGVGFRSLDEEERFAAHLNESVQPATRSRWRNQRGGGTAPQSEPSEAEPGPLSGRATDAVAPSSRRLPRTMEEARFARRAAT